MQRFRLAAILVGLGIIWGLSVPLIKIAVSTGHKPLGIIFWQLLIATFCLSVISVYRCTWPELNRKTLVYFLAIGLLGTIIPNSFSYLVASKLPAGVMGITVASVPMFALCIALALGTERPSLQRLAGVLFGAGAIILLIGPQASLPEPDKAMFVLVALVAPFCYGVEGNYIATQTPQGMNPVATLLGASIIGCVIVWPLALATDSWVDLARPWHDAEWAILLTSLCHVMAYTGYVWLVGTAGAVFASLIAYVTTISAVFLSALILGETYSGWVWSALVLMLIGLVLVQPHDSKQLATEIA